MRDLPFLQKKAGVSLVLSGGATKAFYFHLGVLKVLGTHNLSSIVGSSAGAVMGAFIASGASVDTLLSSLNQKQVYLPKFDTWVRTLTSRMLFRPRYQDVVRQTLYTSWDGVKFLASLPVIRNKDVVAELLDMLVDSQSHVRGFFDSMALEQFFKSVLASASFGATDIGLYVIGTALDSHYRGVFNSVYDVDDGENLFMTDVPIHRAVRASIAVPGMFEPVLIKGRYWVDGEVKQTLSADIGIRLSDTIVISHTYQPLQSEQGSVRDLGWLNIVKQTAFMVVRERIAIWRRIYAQEHPDKTILYVEPEPDDQEFFLAPEFSFRPEVQRRLIASGERAAQQALERAKATF